jgi:alfin
VKKLPRTLDGILRLPRVGFLDRGLLPKESGIYFVLMEASPVRLIYLGKAEDLQARWTGHHREPDLELLESVGVAVEISWLALPRGDVDAAERDLIALFRPSLNERATFTRRRRRIKVDPPSGLSTPSEIVQDYRDRRATAVDALRGDEFWNDCNDHDGDLLCLWPYPSAAEWFDVNNIWMCEDSHPIAPSRVPMPPAFGANHSGFVEPDANFMATSDERRRWTTAVAHQVDAWLVAVAEYHASVVSTDVRRTVLVALSKEETVSTILVRSA